MNDFNENIDTSALSAPPNDSSASGDNVSPLTAEPMPSPEAIAGPAPESATTPTPEPTPTFETTPSLNNDPTPSPDDQLAQMRALHFEKLYTDPAYFQQIAQSPWMQIAASYSPAPEEASYRAANHAYLSNLLQLDPVELKDTYPYFRDGYAQVHFGVSDISERDFFNKLGDQFRAVRENSTLTTPDITSGNKFNNNGAIDVANNELPLDTTYSRPDSKSGQKADAEKGVFITHYGPGKGVGGWDRNHDENSDKGLGLGGNTQLWNLDSLALHKDVAKKYGFKPGDPVYINGKYLGIYADQAPEPGTIDIYDKFNAPKNRDWGGMIWSPTVNKGQ